MSVDNQSQSFGSGATNIDIEITVGDVRYLLISNPENFLDSAGFDPNDSHTLALVYVTNAGETVSASALQEFRAGRLSRDDVFRSEFAENVIFYGSDEAGLVIEPEAIQELKSWGVKQHCIMAAKVAIAPHQVAPVAVDVPHAGVNGRVVVPSRCYFSPSKDRPLAGARICVKDNIDIAGHKTTLCNRAWTDLYPAKTETAPCIQVLIDAGAVIVGKVKLQAMIMREEPLECVEFSAPFNPRADGYQVPSGSSHASAASIASYDWLDFSIGSDTNGSGRKPASYNGCFSIRPSTGIMKTDGVVGYFPQFDMPVFFGRHIFRFPDFISLWYGDSKMLRTAPAATIKLLYPSDYLPTPNPAQTRLIDKFVTGLESALQISRTNVSLADLWKRDCPDGAEHEDIAEYLETAGIYPFYHDQYHNLESFRSEYEEKYGKPPFVQRALHWQWDVGKGVSKKQRDECWRRSEVYRCWMLDKVFETSNDGTVVIMPLPIEVGQPNYRDAPLSPYSLLSGYAALNMSPMLRAPEVTAPVGDIPYLSIVTKREEPLPVAVSLIGAPGTDLILANLVELGMKAAHMPTQVKVGRSMY
ncbi:hypothetical protein NQ176_g2746 [Zarea fungicola]|uniref:Uncharacterized protein n=1 Tax=Zarea fungicola TaxID=93591 RepID=A0ACC1NMX2_9HYPO|nr:hypothetical protein NQ176_g2746 [Lecanicillium fungicola]